MRTILKIILNIFYIIIVFFLEGNSTIEPIIFLIPLTVGLLIELIEYVLFFILKDKTIIFLKLINHLSESLSLRYPEELENPTFIKGALFHNVCSLSVIAFLSSISKILYFQNYVPYLILASLLLNLCIELILDFYYSGSISDWLLVIKDSLYSKLYERSNFSVFLIVFWFLYLCLGNAIISCSWIKIYSGTKNFSFLPPIITNYPVRYIAFIILLCLGIYHLILIIISFFSVRKYNLEVGSVESTKAPFNLGSLNYLWKFIFGRIERTRSNFEILLLKIKADQCVWLTLVSMIVSGSMLICGFIFYSDFLMFVIPISITLFFGIFIHTTIGELGGSRGVLLTFIILIFLNRLGVNTEWFESHIVTLPIVLISSWVMGLLGGIVLRGKIRMSFSVFMIRCKLKQQPGTIKYLWESIINKSLNRAYKKTHTFLFGNTTNKMNLSTSLSSPWIFPFLGGSFRLDHIYHANIKDTYIALLREAKYLFCDNLRGKNIKNFSLGLLPIMPRYRIPNSSSYPSSMNLSRKGEYKWYSQKRELKFKATPSRFIPELSDEELHSLTKTWSEFVDNLVTQNSTIQTDLFLNKFHNGDDEYFICGITRESTSTKEFSTVESETYSCAVLTELLSMIKKEDWILDIEYDLARVIYPSLSYFDNELIDGYNINSHLSLDQSEFFKKYQNPLELFFEELPNEGFLQSPLSKFWKKSIIWGVEVLFSVFIGIVSNLPELINALLSIWEKIK